MPRVRFSLKIFPFFPSDIIISNLWTKSLLVSMGSFTLTIHCHKSGYSKKWIIPASLVWLSTLLYPVFHTVYLTMKKRKRRHAEKFQLESRDPNLLLYLKFILKYYEPVKIQCYEFFDNSNVSEIEGFLNKDVNVMCMTFDFEKLNSPGYNETKKLYLEMFYEVMKSFVKFRRSIRRKEKSDNLYRFVIHQVILTIIENYMKRINKVSNNNEWGFGHQFVVPSCSYHDLFYERIRRAYCTLVLSEKALDDCGTQAHELRSTLRAFN